MNRKLIRSPSISMLLIIVLLFLIPLHSDSEDSDTGFDSVHFGIPDTIAGFEVLGIQTADNTACFPEQFMLVVVRPMQSDSEGDAVFAALQALSVPVRRLSYTVADASFTRDDLVQAVRRNNGWYDENGCRSTGKYMTFRDSPPEPITGETEFDPAHFGIPETIAGFEVVGVQTSANTRCYPAGYMVVAVRSTVDDVEVFTRENRNAIQAELDNLAISDYQSSLTFVSSSASKNDMVYAIRRYNAWFGEGDCRGGPGNPMPVDDSTIVDVKTEFDPAHFGVPDVIAGYEVLVVQSSENTRCFLDNRWRFTLRSSSSGMEGFIRSNNTAAIWEELESLSIPPDIEWGVGTVSPNVTKDYIVRTIRERNIMFGEGNCPPPLGGGIAFLTPTPPADSD